MPFRKKKEKFPFPGVLRTETYGNHRGGERGLNHFAHAREKPFREKEKGDHSQLHTHLSKKGGVVSALRAYLPEKKKGLQRTQL